MEAELRAQTRNPLTRPAMIGAGVVVAAIVVVIAVVATSGGGKEPVAVAKLAQPPPVAIDAAVAVAVDAPPPKPSFGDWLVKANPFVMVNGVNISSHQISREEYRHYLDSLADQKAALPLKDWNAGQPDAPVAWVAFEQARDFCVAAHAALPTSDQWKTASKHSWGIDANGDGHVGPLREWSGTVDSGLVNVMGGHAKMSERQRKVAAAEMMQKGTREAYGESATPEDVASDTIGFRCVR